MNVGYLTVRVELIYMAIFYVGYFNLLLEFCTEYFSVKPLVTLCTKWALAFLPWNLCISDIRISVVLSSFLFNPFL